MFWAWVIPSRTGRHDEQTIIGYDPRDFRIGRTKGFLWTLNIMWKHHIAQRVASNTFETKDSLLKVAVLTIWLSNAAFAESADKYASKT
jgi:hypothetical protein